MSIKINDQIIPDWAIERQAEALFENVAKGMPGKPREIIMISALDLAKERLIDQALMAQESRKAEIQGRFSRTAKEDQVVDEAKWGQKSL